MEYITVGTDTILREYMCDIIDTDRIVKPSGGIWCTDYDVQRPQNCDWINYLIYNTSALLAKSVGKNPFSHKAAIMQLNDNAKVFQLKGNEGLDRFLEFYSKDGKMSFEALSKDYDGVYVSIDGMFGKTYSERERNYNLYSVNTFLLFNIDAIDSYKKANIEIDPFDYESYMMTIPDYRIDVLPGEYKVKELSMGYRYLFEKVVKYFESHYPMDEVSHQRMVSIILDIIMTKFNEELRRLKDKENLDERRVAQAMATKVLSRKNK